MQQDLLAAERQLNQLRRQATRENFWKQVPLLIRNSLLLLAYAVGFAGLGQRRYSEVPWLLECRNALKGLPRLLRWRRRTGPHSSGRSMTNYVEVISRDQQS